MWVIPLIFENVAGAFEEFFKCLREDVGKTFGGWSGLFYLFQAFIFGFFCLTINMPVLPRVSVLYTSAEPHELQETYIAAPYEPEKNLKNSPADIFEKTIATNTHSTHSAEMNLLAQLVQAEAGNQPLTGMRFVADVVLNRVDDPRFPDNIRDVIFQSNPTQFSVTVDGAFERAYNNISDDAWRAVELEWEERLDYEVLYFSSTPQPINGTRPFKYYDHWFSY